jgi:hypothetical protein
LVARRLTENVIADFCERVIKRRAVAGPNIRNCIPQNRALVCERRQDVNRGDRTSGRLLIVEGHDRDPIASSQRTDEYVCRIADQTELLARRTRGIKQ